MNFEISDEQEIIRHSFARFLDEHSSMARVRRAMATGFDADLWRGLAELGAFGLRVGEAHGGSDLGTLDAAIVMAEVGRTLATGPIAEAMMAVRLLSELGGEAHGQLLGRVIAGEEVLTIAYHDVAEQARQWIAGGAVATHVIAREGSCVRLFSISPSPESAEANLASAAIAEIDLSGCSGVVLADGCNGVEAFQAAMEEWKLLTAAALAGLARAAIQLASEYAKQRMAFGQPIGSFQGIAHPLADCICEVDAGHFLVWKAIDAIGAGADKAGALIPLALWWNADAAGRAVQQSLQTFGGYGLTVEYDIHLFNLRAMAWPLLYGDTWRFLEEAGECLYGNVLPCLPDVGKVSLDFEFGEEAMILAHETDAFFREHLTPELKAKAHYSWDGHDPDLHKKLAEAGLLFPSWPKELGGREARPYEVKASRSVWEDHEWTTYPTVTTEMVGEVLRRFATDEVRRTALAQIAAGEAVCCLGYSEPGAGSDVFATRTRATRDGEGWRINGQKMFTSGADVANYVLLLARTDPEAAKHKGLTMFLVPTDSPGFTVQLVQTFQDERTNITYYDEVYVADIWRIGDVGQGVRVMAVALEIEQGAGPVKPLQSLLIAAETLCREITYRGRPLIEDRAAQARLARTAALAELANLLVMRTTWAAAEQKPYAGYGPMGRMFAADRFLQAATDMLNLTAPMSLSQRDGPAAFVNQCYRHAHGTRVYGGTREVHRSTIAERNLGLPRSRLGG